MSKKLWTISDFHFGHDNAITKFKRDDGSPLRDFESAQEMNETIISNYNKVVSDDDTVYILGDVAINRKYVSLCGQLKGRKILILGNHDIFTEDKKCNYTLYFDRIHANKVYMQKGSNGESEGIVMTHFPVVGNNERFLANIHGHTHWNLVGINPAQRVSDSNPPSKWYVNVCVERTNYKPVNLIELIEMLKRGEHPLTHGYPTEI
jgi:calcineurin-like phosphoesterase family protein